MLMKYRTNTTASAWTDLWVDKFTAELGKTGLAENEIPPHLSILRKYLAANPGNPRAIELAGLKKFLSVNA
ncbi:MAG: hypothetical protein MUF22_08760, partial [Chitinispirillaceae bacterium]|nr:hypothetical protein [Chitinispirillaceae bacterium]